MVSGPIMVIEDDVDDQEIITEVLADLRVKNKVVFFEKGNEAIEYLKSTSEQPFIIFCDINMPYLNGIEVRAEINKDEQLKAKATPFIFLTTSASKDTITKAYMMNVQGFFKKPDTLEDMKQIFQEILSYWSKSQHPNSGFN